MAANRQTFPNSNLRLITPPWQLPQVQKTATSGFKSPDGRCHIRLMLFFIACAGAQVKEELNIALPSGRPPEPQQHQDAHRHRHHPKAGEHERPSLRRTGRQGAFAAQWLKSTMDPVRRRRSRHHSPAIRDRPKAHRRCPQRRRLPGVKNLTFSGRLRRRVPSIATTAEQFFPPRIPRTGDRAKRFQSPSAGWWKSQPSAMRLFFMACTRRALGSMKRLSVNVPWRAAVPSRRSS